MAMLAEPRRRQRIGPNPRGKFFTEDEDNRGRHMLQKMGWSKGDGLGAGRQGMVDPIKPKINMDSKGLGFEVKSDPWVAHTDDFNSLLKHLQTEHEHKEEEERRGQKDKKTKGPEEDVEMEEDKFLGLEKKSKKSRSRIHYQKFVRNKDLSKLQDKDWSCIFGQQAGNKDNDQTKFEQQSSNNDDSPHPPVTSEKDPIQEDLCEAKETFVNCEYNYDYCEDVKPMTSDQWNEDKNVSSEWGQPQPKTASFYKSLLSKAFVKSTLPEDQPKEQYSSPALQEATVVDAIKPEETGGDEGSATKKRKKKDKSRALADTESTSDSLVFPEETQSLDAPAPELCENEDQVCLKKKKKKKYKHDDNDDDGHHEEALVSVPQERLCNTEEVANEVTDLQLKKKKKRKKEKEVFQDDDNELPKIHPDEEITSLAPPTTDLNENEDHHRLKKKSRKKDRSKSDVHEEDGLGLHEAIVSDEPPCEVDNEASLPSKKKKKRKTEKEGLDSEIQQQEVEVQQNDDNNVPSKKKKSKKSKLLETGIEDNSTSSSIQELSTESIDNDGETETSRHKSKRKKKRKETGEEHQEVEVEESKSNYPPASSHKKRKSKILNDEVDIEPDPVPSPEEVPEPESKVAEVVHKRLISAEQLHAAAKVFKGSNLLEIPGYRNRSTRL